MHSEDAKAYLQHLIVDGYCDDTHCRELLAMRIGELVLGSLYVDTVVDLLWQTCSDELARLFETTGNFRRWQFNQTTHEQEANRELTEITGEG